MKYFKFLIFLAISIVFLSASCGKDDNNSENTETTDEFADDSTEGTTDDSTDDSVVEIQKDTIRFASFNVSMYGETAEQVASQTANFGNVKYARVARIIQEIRPDVLALMEFDYDASGQSLENFKTNFLEYKLEESGDTIVYNYAYQVPSNTGLLSEVDIDGNGSVSLPNDAFGFGNFEGQYAFAILSKYPLDLENIRSFQQFLWKDIPNALLPENADGSSYYSEEALAVFRISSKNHIDIPVQLPNGKTVHTILAHPTPPVFDGAEDRNGKRNHDEIKLLADYINDADYLIDDAGQSGGLASDNSFVIMGDLNADPVDGDSAENPILQLLNNENINQAVCFGENIPQSNGGAEHNQQANHEGNPAFDTSFFGLRIDYVLPSADLEVLESGVFWPSSTEELYYLVEDEGSSDHLMVWVDLVVE